MEAIVSPVGEDDRDWTKSSGAFACKIGGEDSQPLLGLEVKGSTVTAPSQYLGLLHSREMAGTLWGFRHFAFTICSCPPR